MKSSAVLYLALLAVAAGALAFRLPRLEQRPMHTDEAVQAVKFGDLYENGRYEFDPFEYHGPTLNYATLAVSRFGTARGPAFADTTEFTCRIVPVLFGVATILLLCLLAGGLGWPAVIIAAILTAISPTFVFYNRYYIHESLLIFFTVGLIGAGWRYVVTRKLGWALAAGACVGCMHATKETFVLTCAAMVGALICTKLWSRLRGENWQLSPPCPLSEMKAVLPLRVLALSILAAAVVSAVLFSSFFTHARGPLDSILTYKHYLTRAGGGIHDHPWYFYLQLLLYYKEEGGPLWTEALIVVLALVGFVVALLRRGDVFHHKEREGHKEEVTEDALRCVVPLRVLHGSVLVRFLAFYTVLLTAMYAIISYKTPWCMMSFLHGMILLAAVGTVAVFKALRGIAPKAVFCVVLLAGLGHLGWEAYRANFDKRYYADWRNPYVYAHTGADIYRLAERMESLAKVHPDGYNMLVKVISRDYWPVPWYVRRFKNVGYWHTPEAGADAPVIITSPETEDALASVLRGQYHNEFYGLRPQVFLKLYIEKNLWDELLKRRAAAPKP